MNNGSFKKSQLIKIAQITWRPIIMAAIIAFIWYLKKLYLNGFLIYAADQETFTQSVIPTIAIFHAIFAAQVTHQIVDEFDRTHRAVSKQDFEEFKMLASKRLHVLVKSFLVILSILLESAMFLVEFNSILIGVFSIYAVSFIVAAFYGFIADLDNPIEGVYNLDLPADWFKRLKNEK